MNVLLVCRTLQGRGGTEKHVKWLAKSLNERNIETKIFPIAHFWQIPELAWTMRRYRIVHFFLPKPYVYGSIAALLIGHRRCIMSRRSMAESYQTPWLRWFERLLHKRTIALVANSYAVLDELCGETNPQKCHVIRAGIDADTVECRQRVSVQGPRLPDSSIGFNQGPDADPLAFVDSWRGRAAAV